MDRDNEWVRVSSVLDRLAGQRGLRWSWAGTPAPRPGIPAVCFDIRLSDGRTMSAFEFIYSEL